MLEEPDQDAWTLEATNDDYPIGTHRWVRGQGDNEESRTLKLTQCSKQEFSCWTYANCIPLSKRCDGIVDCPDDRSDEENCSLTVIDDTYQKRQTPNANLTVYATLRVINLQYIKELDSKFTLQFQLIMEWNDPRVEFRNLKSRNTANMILGEDRDQFWLPSLDFVNTDSRLGTLVDDTTVLMALRETSPELKDLDAIYEDLVYPGSKNKLKLARTYTVQLKCKFNMFMFPFDRQACPLVLDVPRHLDETVTLELINVSTTMEPEVSSYQYEGLTVVSKRIGHRIEVKMGLKRIYTMYFATTFLPTSCLVAVAELTLFIDEAHFEATIMVALTSMLVMYTLYQSVVSSLPATAYIKLIDLWLLVGLLLPFAVFMILVIVDATGNNNIIQPTLAEYGIGGYGKSTSKKNRRSRILTWSRLVIPLGTGLFFIVFFFYGMSGKKY